MTETISPAEQQLQTILEAAQQMGVELDREEALQWLTAIAATQSPDQVKVNERTGVFGHRVVMLDFSEEQLAYFREVGRLVEFKDEPGVETALALSGSAAQSKVQSYPGGCDYFERVNIHAARRGLCHAAMNGCATRRSPHAVSPAPNSSRSSSAPTRWTSSSRGGATRRAHRSPGSRPDRKRPDRGRAAEQRALSSVGKMLRQIRAGASWTGPRLGTPATRQRQQHARCDLGSARRRHQPLDGHLDPYFQEVYLEADSIPIFTKLSRHVSCRCAG